MGADDVRTVHDLKGHQAIVLPMVGEFGGRIIDTAGDGILAEFPSVVNAVECAVAIQTTMAERNATDGAGAPHAVPQSASMSATSSMTKVRIYGDGINVAARLEGIAEAGGICISSKVYDEINGRLDLACHDIGVQQLKNIVRPVRAYHVRLDGSAPAAAPLPAPSDKPSIAVLPFQNMSGDPEQEYFADGMVEDIITALSRIKWLFVIARNSSFTYKGRAVDIKQIGRELGVRYVLEGSIRKAANKVRITGQLIEAATGHHIWADRWDGAYEDVFELQDRITQRVVSAIEPSIQSREIERIRSKPTDSLEAYDLYLRALPEFYSYSAEGYGGRSDCATCDYSRSCLLGRLGGPYRLFGTTARQAAGWRTPSEHRCNPRGSGVRCPIWTGQCFGAGDSSVGQRHHLR